MKSVLTSIQPKWVVKIASGEKTFDVRKTAPKLKPPFKCYIYSTKQGKIFFHNGIGSKEVLYRNPDTKEIKFDYPFELMACKNEYNEDNFLSGKVVGEYICDEIKEYPAATIACAYYETNGAYVPEEGQFQRGTCLSYQEMYNYSEGKTLYGWHISELKIYDKPKEISEFYNLCDKYKVLMGCVPHKNQPKKCQRCLSCGYTFYDSLDCELHGKKKLVHAPQSWCYVGEI